MRVRTTILAAALTAGGFAVLPIASAQAGPGQATTLSSDFNGDGYRDLAVGAINEEAGSVSNAGAVNVIYSNYGGPNAGAAQQWTQLNSGVPNQPTTGEQFGKAIATGDFNDDGYADLAVGAPYDRINGGTSNRVGSVTVLMGSPTGLHDSDQTWFQVLENQPVELGDYDRFGDALSAGDFNKDGKADLAIGAPGDNEVDLLYGSGQGLQFVGSKRIAGYTVDSSAGEFGTALTTGDFDADGRDDLAASAPKAGGVAVLHGSLTGLSTNGYKKIPYWQVFSDPKAGGTFGESLAAGNLGNGAADDLVIGDPSRDVGGKTAGAVAVLYGSDASVSSQNKKVVTQNDLVPNGSQTNEGFGAAVAVGDVTDSSVEDLVIGVPREDVSGQSHSGGLHVLKGAQAGVLTTGSQFLSQATPNLPGTPTTGDNFGQALAVTQLAGGGKADIVIGARMDEDFQPVIGGTVTVLRGADGAITASGNLTFSLWTGGVPGTPHNYDEFGRSVAAAG